jgi:hypothetical protein
MSEDSDTVVVLKVYILHVCISESCSRNRIVLRLRLRLTQNDAVAASHLWIISLYRVYCVQDLQRVTCEKLELASHVSSLELELERGREELLHTRDQMDRLQQVTSVPDPHSIGAWIQILKGLKRTKLKGKTKPLDIKNAISLKMLIC